MSSNLGMKNMKRACENTDLEKISLSNFAGTTCIHQHPHINDQPLKLTGTVSSFTLL